MMVGETMDTPKYTIKTVAKLADLNAATLRAWEKRYGIPAPSRTPARYRLYSDSDVMEIRWVKARVDEGIPPRQAARFAAERRHAGLTTTGAASTGPAGLVADVKVAALAFDEDGVGEVLRRAGSTMAPFEIFRGVLLPAVVAIGRDWEAGLVTVAQEHFASQIVKRYAHRLLDYHQTRATQPPVVCACAPGEQHEIGLLTVAIELRRRAIPVVYLGADTPVESLLSTAERLHAPVAVVGITVDRHLQPWVDQREAARAAAERPGTAMIWAGPGAAGAEASGLPGTIALDIDTAVSAVVRRIAQRA
jgi:DNA-binding transcriptional MerR regulator